MSLCWLVFKTMKKSSLRNYAPSLLENRTVKVESVDYITILIAILFKIICYDNIEIVNHLLFEFDVKKFLRYNLHIIGFKCFWKDFFIPL